MRLRVPGAEVSQLIYAHRAAGFRCTAVARPQGRGHPAIRLPAFDVQVADSTPDQFKNETREKFRREAG